MSEFLERKHQQRKRRSDDLLGGALSSSQQGGGASTSTPLTGTPSTLVESTSTTSGTITHKARSSGCAQQPGSSEPPAANQGISCLANAGRSSQRVPAARSQVTKMDTLAGIAIKYNVTVRTLAQLSLALPWRNSCCPSRQQQRAPPHHAPFAAGGGHQARERAALGQRHVRAGRAAHTCGRRAARVRLQRAESRAPCGLGAAAAAAAVHKADEALLTRACRLPLPLPGCREELQVLFARTYLGLGRDPVLNAEANQHPATAAAARAARALKCIDHDGPHGEGAQASSSRAEQAGSAAAASQGEQRCSRLGLCVLCGASGLRDREGPTRCRAHSVHVCATTPTQAAAASWCLGGAGAARATRSWGTRRAATGGGAPSSATATRSRASTSCRSGGAQSPAALPPSPATQCCCPPTWQVRPCLLPGGHSRAAARDDALL